MITTQYALVHMWGIASIAVIYILLWTTPSWFPTSSWWTVQTIQGLSQVHIKPLWYCTFWIVSTRDWQSWLAFLVQVSSRKVWNTMHSGVGSLNGIYTSLVHHSPATLNSRSATGCVVHGSGFLPTTSPTRDDETRRVDGSVHE